MLGFEITLNGKPINAAIENGVLTVILTHRAGRGKDDISLHIAGLDLDAGTDTTWLKEDEIRAGDEIIVKVKKIEQVSTPKNKIDLDKELVKKNRVSSYYELKSSLEKEGLI
jgi:hypothetical protein